jgi:hypothetical protein
VVVVHLAWAYVERRTTEERSAQIRSYGDLMRWHREEHAEAWLTAALQEAMSTGEIEPVLRRYLRHPA